MIYNIKNILSILSFISYSFLINYEKIDASIIKYLIHSSIQSIIIIGIYSIIHRRTIIKLILSILLSVILFMKLSFDSTITISAIMSLLNTAKGEATDFFTDNLKAIVISSLLFLFMSMYSIKSKILTRISIVFGFIYLITPSIIFYIQTKGGEEYNHHMNLAKARGFGGIIAEIEYVLYRDMSWRFPPLQSIRGMIDFFMYFGINKTGEPWSHVMENSGRKGIFVLGIGESLRASHLSVYGYHIETTPWLSSIIEEISLYKYAYAAGVNTWMSLPLMLTSSVSGTENLNRTIVNLAAMSGYKVIWISNHEKFAATDFFISNMASQADKSIFLTELSSKENRTLDEEIIPILEKEIINNSHEEKLLIIIHFYGSHSMFKNRYPENFRKINFHDDETLNEYDTTVLYFDYIQKNIMEIISKYDAEYVFIADHGLTGPKENPKLKHDVRVNPNPDSLHVPFFSYPKNIIGKEINIDEETPVSLFYMECIFADWLSIKTEDLNYCKESEISGEKIIFFNANKEKMFHYTFVE